MFITNILFWRSKKDLDKKRAEADEMAVKAVINTVNSMLNPFESDKEELVHLASGAVANSTIATDMKKMLEKGQFAEENFVKENLLRSGPNIYAIFKKTKLETFSSLGKKVTNKTKKGNLVDLKNSKALFTKMLLVARSRNLQLEDIFRYSLRPFPSSLATREGDLVKTSKAKLLHVTEDKVKDCTVSQPQVPDKACILDAVAIIQTVAPVQGTFGELATHLLKEL